jgi:hypothetical protein
MSEKNNDIYSNAVRAGKRTYFFDVKATKGNELYLTITESKKATIDGKETFQKHKLFLYKEDFEKFQDGLSDVLAEIEKLNDTGDFRTETYENESNETSEEITFESL